MTKARRNLERNQNASQKIRAKRRARKRRPTVFSFLLSSPNSVGAAGRSVSRSALRSASLALLLPFPSSFGFMPSRSGAAGNNPFPPSPGAFCRRINPPFKVGVSSSLHLVTSSHLLIISSSLHMVISSSHHLLPPQPDPPSSTPPPRPP